MTPREALQFRQLMTEETAAQALVMKGEFTKEINELKSLIDEWDKRGKINARLKDLAAQTEAFKLETEDFDKAVNDHYKQVDKVKAREDACKAREDALAAKETEAVKVAADLANAKDKHDAQMIAEADAVLRSRADIALQQADLSATRKELDAREKAVAEKLAALKALAS